jgi:hypothetical protein
VRSVLDHFGGAQIDTPGQGVEHGGQVSFEKFRAFGGKLHVTAEPDENGRQIQPAPP